MSLQKATEPPHAPRNTPRASATTTRLYPADQGPIPRVSNYLLAAGRHRPPSIANSPAPPTARAPAGHHSPNRNRCRRTPATPRIPSPRSPKPSRTCARLPRPSVQRQHACNRHSSSVSTQIGSGIASQQGLAEHMVRTVPTGHVPAHQQQPSPSRDDHRCRPTCRSQNSAQPTYDASVSTQMQRKKHPFPPPPKPVQPTTG